MKTLPVRQYISILVEILRATPIAIPSGRGLLSIVVRPEGLDRAQITILLIK
jgi:hypothetical protein